MDPIPVARRCLTFAVGTALACSGVSSLSSRFGSRFVDRANQIAHDGSPTGSDVGGGGHAWSQRNDPVPPVDRRVQQRYARYVNRSQLLIIDGIGADALDPPGDRAVAGERKR